MTTTVKPAVSDRLAVVGMSGGVDSSAAALLLREQGWKVVGVTLHLYDNETAGLEPGRTCCSLDDVEDARRTCWRLDCPHYTLNRKDLFLREVIDPFVETYEAGRTPNPCIDCNRSVKFPALYQTMETLGGSVIATGHYAQVERSGDRYLLKKGKDAAKDQSYMLYTLTQTQLAHTVFPLGGLTKDEVRALAQERGLTSAAKPDSQDICFVPDGDYTAFLRRHTGRMPEPGPFVDPEGQVLGTHRGQLCYTIGQRRGLGVSAPHRLYVCDKDPAANTVTLAEEFHLYRRELDAVRLNLTALERLDQPLRLNAKIRYHHREQPAWVEQTGPDSVHVTFDQPQRAVAPGQSLVLYDGEYVVGGGIIV
ncbi:MAG: tRNA 2-thiouridine(34) synthase MnmA [Clostridiales bacterium]|nr:tRNA 2-thiouridine(34) synthase MnmA [Clostridiales bacterium]